MSANLALAAALAALALWYVLVTFVTATTGTIHLLLAVGTILLIRWWALRS